jgi:4-carboxymuconolactone decarboxylase
MPVSERFSDTTRHLVRISAAVAGATIGVVRRVMGDAKGNVPPDQVDEVLLQSYLFAGFPRTLNAFGVWRELSGHAAPSEDAQADVQHASSWAERGEATCRTVYGRVYQSLRDNIRALHPAIDAWMVVDGYGKVLSRPALDLVSRELCIVAACSAAEQMPQLRSHLRGARNSGASLDDLALTVNALSDVISLDAMTSARDALARLKEL